MVQRNQRGDSRCTSGVPWRSRRNSAPNYSLTATTTPNPTSANAVLPCSRLPTDTPPMPWPTPAYSKTATPTRSTPGSTTSTRKDCPASSPTNTVATVEAVFNRDQQLREQLQERLHQGPGEQARQQAAATPQGPPPSR